MTDEQNNPTMTTGRTHDGTLQIRIPTRAGWRLQTAETPFVPPTHTYIVTLRATDRTGLTWGDGIIVNAESEHAAIDTVRAMCNVPDHFWQQGYDISEIDPRTFDAEEHVPDEEQ